MDPNTFPVDVFLQIAALLDRESLLNLRLVSQDIHSAITPTALRNVRVFVGEHHDDYKVAINRRLETCASPLSNLYGHAKHLRFSISAFYISRYMSKDLLPDLWRTMAKLRSITSFSLEWDDGYNSTEEGLKEMPIMIGKAVESLLEATGGKLERLDIQPSGGNSFPQALANIRGLEFLKVVRNPWGYGCHRNGGFTNRLLRSPAAQAGHTLSCSCTELPIADIFGPLIAANPGLEELEVVVGCHVRGYRPDLILPSNLTKLTSLTVGGLNFGQNGFPIQTCIDPAPLRNLRHLNASSTYKCSSLEITSTFVNQVLPRHAETLENLSLSIDTDQKPIEGWTFDLNQWPATLSQLNKLRSLAIHPLADPEQSRYYSPSEDSLINGYQTLIDHAESLPSLEKLKINWINQSFGCGTGYMSWRRGCCETLAKITPRLAGTTGRPQVLSLFNGLHTPTKIRDDLDGSERWIWGLQNKTK
ncbi:hypothetical protein BDN72DRAFT_838608 [Pluteus cervinus]|uniref:Uncharacterized protein n=1 Tax=Pluteus cervinus TaxID=181527 RepID=A0ACD3AXZ5_9AGAR|nr:hypothetical protein BDN72DRAFT_838608 [Pluteus cervinus]